MKNINIKSDMLKKPSIINMIACGLRKLIGEEKKKKVSYPKVIGPYKLVSNVRKTNNLNNYGIGIYKDIHGRKVFIKAWQGKTKNFPFYSLVNEYNMVKILSEKIKNTQKSKFQVPNPIGYVKTDNTLSVIFEYVEGKPLSKSPIKTQSRIICEAILFLDRLTQNLNKIDVKYIKKRDMFFYFFSLPVVFLYSFLLEKESKRTIFYSFLKTCFYSITALKRKLTLAHGDLDPNNVLVTDSHFYILDSEHMMYTLAEYDLNYLSIGNNLKNLYLDIVKKRKDFARDNFLCFYMSMKFSIFIDQKTKQRPYFDFLKN